MDLRKPKLQWRKAVPSSRLNPSVKVWETLLEITICPPFAIQAFFFIKNEVWIKSCSFFREEVILFWRWGVWTLYWGGLLQRRACFLSSTRWSHAATGTTFPSLLLRQLLFTIKPPNGQCPPFVAGEKMYLGLYLGEWEELSWCAEKDIRGMHIRLQWAHIHCYMILNILFPLYLLHQHYEKPLSQIEPRLLSDRKLKITFYRVREILQCHFLFQIALASRVAEWDSLEMIGDVFVASVGWPFILQLSNDSLFKYQSHIQCTSPNTLNMSQLLCNISITIAHLNICISVIKLIMAPFSVMSQHSSESGLVLDAPQAAL